MCENVCLCVWVMCVWVCVFVCVIYLCQYISRNKCVTWDVIESPMNVSTPPSSRLRIKTKIFNLTQTFKTSQIQLEQTILPLELGHAKGVCGKEALMTQRCGEVWKLHRIAALHTR